MKRFIKDDDTAFTERITGTKLTRPITLWVVAQMLPTLETHPLMEGDRCLDLRSGCSYIRRTSGAGGTLHAALTL